ncbi:MAG: hypothetical protein P1V20_06430 [Verrucomicrobiales bacterium]|nr:hypothetical protein [Verrucomicrobiales bacterium]
MELSVEPLYIEPPNRSGGKTHHQMDFSHERSLDEWNEAYQRIENYFLALGVENKLLLSSVVLKILGKASDRMESEDAGQSPVELACYEADRLLVDWFRNVLDDPGSEFKDRISARGRLALWNVQEEVPWQEYFLSDEPLPRHYREKMQTAYLHADPDFQFVEMKPRPIDLGLVKIASNTLERMSRRRKTFVRILWLIGILFCVWIFIATR